MYSIYVEGFRIKYRLVSTLEYVRASRVGSDLQKSAISNLYRINVGEFTRYTSEPWKFNLIAESVVKSGIDP